MIRAEHLVMEFDLNHGKIRSLKEKLLSRQKPEKLPLRAVNDVSFTVETGEIFGVVGENGAGKSTLLKILSRIMLPTSGTVAIDGVIAPMIELGTGFDFELSGMENILLSGAVLGYTRSFVTSKISEILDFSELWDFKDIPVKYYSSGMVARLGFAISTYVVPDVLIVDEILSVGDAAFQKKSAARMRKLMEGGATVVYVSHDLESVRRLCDRAMWMEKGAMRMLGEVGEVCDAYMAYTEEKQ